MLFFFILYLHCLHYVVLEFEDVFFAQNRYCLVQPWHQQRLLNFLLFLPRDQALKPVNLLLVQKLSLLHVRNWWRQLRHSGRHVEPRLDDLLLSLNRAAEAVDPEVVNVFEVLRIVHELLGPESGVGSALVHHGHCLNPAWVEVVVVCDELLV